MKKIPLCALLLICAAVTLHAQDTCAFSMQPGDSIVFKQLLPPALDVAFFKMKPKEKLEFLKKQDEDIKAGKANFRTGRISILITARETTPTGFSAAATLTLANPNPYVLPMRYECINDTFYAHPENQFTETPGVGVTFTGAAIYPAKMKVGDLLPDYKNITIGYKVTGSNQMMLPFITKTITTNYVNLQGQTLYSSIQNVWSAKEVTNNFSGITTTENTYANREVVGDTTITYKGKTYTGYIIKYSIINTIATAITADYYQKAIQRTLNRGYARANRSFTDEEKAAINFNYKEVFVPELGSIGTTITKQDGAFFSKTELTE